MRLMRESEFRYGLNDFTVEADSGAELSSLLTVLTRKGWLGEQGRYRVHSRNVPALIADFQAARAQVVSGWPLQ